MEIMGVSSRELGSSHDEIGIISDNVSAKIVIVKNNHKPFMNIAVSRSERLDHGIGDRQTVGQPSCIRKNNVRGKDEKEMYTEYGKT